MNRMLTLLLLALLTISVSAQTTVYPVQTITTIAPPAPVSLEDMYTGAADRVVVQVVVGDASVVNYPVKFKITIAGRGIEISTSPAFNPDPVLLNGGETQLFNGTDLARYFDPANLIFRGYSEAQYRKTGRLPEGAYRLTVDVVDYNRNVTVSKSLAAGQMFIFENEPPLLNFPMKDELLSALMPQNILFSWTPRQNPYSSPTFVPEYKFELWEIWPEDKNPNEIVRSTEPIYTVNLQTPSFLYTVNEPLLFTGRQYVWRIQVVDPEGIVQFKQNGYSEIRLFRFGKFCPVPEPAIEKTGPAHIALKWEGDSRITKYDVRYRIKKSKNREWYSKSTPFLGVDIDNLKANTAYEFQVCAYCDDQPGEYSPILTASTREETKFQCGATPPNPLLDNTNPLDKLGPRDIIHAGDFDVMVASASGSGGNFSGKGWVLVPYLKFIKIEVEFSNISVNDEYRLTAGEIKTVYNIDNAMVASVGDLSFLYSDKPKAVENNDFVKVTKHIYRPDSTITSITISNGVVTITTDNGEKIQVRADNKGIVAVAPQDETSTQYVADTKTNTVYTGTPETNKGNASATNAVPQPKQANTQYKVEFLAHPQEEAGTDYPNDKRPAGNYETIQLDGKAVLVPWKSMEAAKYDRLVAKISGGPADTVRYRRQSEVMVMTAPMSNADGDKLNKSTAASGYKQLLLSSLGQMDEDKLYAWYPEYETVNDTLKRQNRVLAGQMNLASYDKLALNVYLVSVNGSAIPKVNDVQNALNAIYKPAVVTWTVNPFGNLDVILKNGKSKILDISDLKNDMEYTTEMDKVKAALKKTAGYSGKNYYIFFFNGFIPPAGKNPDGYMPFNCNFGFVKTTNTKTIAHELGHGAFRLRHPFSPSCPYPQAEGTTDNLMDYTSDKNATALLKYQWDEVHDRDLGVNLGEDAGEGEFSNYYRLFDNLYPNLIKSNPYIVNCNGMSYRVPRGKMVKTIKNVGDYIFETDEVQTIEWKDLTEEDFLEYKLAGKDYRKDYPYGVKEIKTYKRINLNSPMTIRYLTNRSVDFEKVDDGIVAVAQDLLDEWLSKNPWKVSSGYGIQNLQNLANLEKDLTIGGNLDCRNFLDKNSLYYVPTEVRSLDSRGIPINDRMDKSSGSYYNYDEISYWIWGYIAKRLNFPENKAIAYAALFMDKNTPYDFSNLTKNWEGQITITGTPWMCRAVKNGFNWPQVTPAPNINEPYTLVIDPLIGIDDLITISVFIPVYGEGAVLAKITVKIAKKMLTAAFTDWFLQASINVLIGEEDPFTSIDWNRVITESISSQIEPFFKEQAFKCGNIMITEFMKDGEFRGKEFINGALLCIKSMIVSASFNKICKDPNGIYYKKIVAAYNRRGKQTVSSSIVKFLKNDLKMSKDEILRSLGWLPQELTEVVELELAKLLKN